jgi:hypothetical protein
MKPQTDESLSGPAENRFRRLFFGAFSVAEVVIYTLLGVLLTATRRQL